MNSIKDDRTSLIEKVDLEDFSDVPIPEENLALAKQYGVTATPVLIVTDDAGEKLGPALPAFVVAKFDSTLIMCWVRLANISLN